METETNDLLTNWLQANLAATRARRGQTDADHGPLITVTTEDDAGRRQTVMPCRCGETTRAPYHGYPRYRHTANGRLPIGPGRYYVASMGTPPPEPLTAAWPNGWTEIGHTDE
jgi:hypothetical protein